MKSTPAREIYDVGRGDYVRDGNGTLHPIAYIEAVIDQVRPKIHYRSWSVHTVDGAHLTMTQIHSYHLREDALA